jgi:hypothetical protein
VPVPDLWKAPSQEFASTQAIPLRAGWYDLVLVATAGPAVGGEARGRLNLWVVPQRRRHPENRAITFLYDGATDIDLAKVGSPSVAYPVSSTNRDEPGVEVSYNGSTISLDFGNAWSPTLMRMDQGTLLWVLAMDSTHTRGRWQDGGRALAPASGYFCLTPAPR